MKKHITKASKVFALALIITIGLTACKKDKTSPNSSGSGSGTPAIPSYNLRFTCTSSNPYQVDVNGGSAIVQGNSYKDYKLQQGTYNWKVTQQSGYALYPTVEQGTVNLDQDKEITFP